MEKFNINSNGYDINEVNSFVNRVTTEYENMLNKLKAKDEELLSLRSKVNHYKDIETTLNKAMLVAEDSSNQMKKVAREEAQLIIDEAKKNANHIVNDALLKAEKTDMEADNLRRSLKIYKARIKQVVEEQLSMVDDVDKITMDDRGE
ncbi:MAG: DivIVA domain-containing protein [Bacilli bacterium]|nr:DivIVA domain-containing protein [Bacilli bacterium]